MSDPEHEPDYNRMIVAEARLDVAEARLAQIRALCDYADRGLSEGPTGWVDTVDIRAVLNAPPVDATPPQGRRAGTEFTPGHSMNVVERVTARLENDQ